MKAVCVFTYYTCRSCFCFFCLCWWQPKQGWMVEHICLQNAARWSHARMSVLMLFLMKHLQCMQIGVISWH